MRRVKFASLVALGFSLFLGTNPVAAASVSFASFANPIGVAYAPGHLLVTNYCDPHAVYAIDDVGTVKLFAPLPDQGGCVEVYLTVSPGGIPRWPANQIYAIGTTGTIFKIDPNRHVSTFAQLPACGLTHNALTFDDQGLFGHVLLATCSTGEIYKVDRRGTPTLLTTIPDFIEGPDVAPLSFGNYGGNLFVTAENTGNIYAVTPAGGVTLVATWPGAEGINFIPTNVCSFDGSQGAYFRAHFPTEIIASPASDFAGLGGQGLVRSESGAGAAVLDASGAIAPFGQDGGLQIEGATFVDFSRGCRFNKP